MFNMGEKAKFGGLWCAIAAKNGDIKGEPPGNIPKVGGRRGRADNRSFSNSASWSLFALALRFWNQIFTCNKKTISTLSNYNFLVTFAEIPTIKLLTERFQLTCVSVRRKELENSARSAMLRYCLSLNFFSSANSCCVVKGVLGFRFGLCFLKAHRTIGGPFTGIFWRFAVKKK